MLIRAILVALFLLSIASCLTPGTAVTSQEKKLPSAHKTCTNCHTFSEETGRATLSAGQNPDNTCTTCHAVRISQGEHKVGVKAENTAIELPLFNGNISCITCHEPHGLSPHQSLLRLPARDLCTRCHSK